MNVTTRRRPAELRLEQHAEHSVEPAADLELERDELVELLDRALALLPPASREILVRRYVDESPPAEIAGRLGLSEGAVAMRLQRGRLALRRVLSTELRDTAAEFDLLDRSGSDAWHTTRMWCFYCGRQRLLGRFERHAAGVLFQLRCAACCIFNKPSQTDHNMIALLRRRDFGLLWFGGLISLIGNWTMITVLPFQMYDRTGSTLAAGSLWLMYFIPGLLFGSFAGVFADRWDRKRTMVVVNLLQAALMLVLLAARSDSLLWLIFVVVFLESSLSQFFMPAENALLPRLVGEENLVAANALNALNDNLARIAGPAIGAALFAMGGMPAAVVLDSASFLVAALLIWQIRTPGEPFRSADREPHTGNPLVQFLREWIAGLSLVRKSRLLLAVFIVMGVSLLADSILTAMLVPFVDSVVQGGVQALGFVFSVRGVGGLVGSIVVPIVARSFAPRSMLGLGLIAVGLLLAIAINVADVWVVLGCMLLVGVPVIAWLSTQQMLVQTGAPDELRGRVFGAYGTTNAVMLLIGTGSASVLGDIVGIVTLMNLAPALYALAGGIALVTVPAEAGRQEPKNQGTKEPRNQGTKEPGNQGTEELRT